MKFIVIVVVLSLILSGCAPLKIAAVVALLYAPGAIVAEIGSRSFSNVSEKNLEVSKYDKPLEGYVFTQPEVAYKEPSFESENFIPVNEGEEINFITVKDEWVLIESSEGEAGWIHLSKLQIDDSTINSWIVKQQDRAKFNHDLLGKEMASVQELKNSKLKIENDSVFLYGLPLSADGDISGSYYQYSGFTLNVLRETENWYEVETPAGDIGWVHKKELKINGQSKDKK